MDLVSTYLGTVSILGSVFHLGQEVGYVLKKRDGSHVGVIVSIAADHIHVRDKWYMDDYVRFDDISCIWGYE
jgi:hypothetical protein